MPLRFFSPVGRPRSWWRRLKRKRKTRSSASLILGSVNWIAFVVQIVLSGVLAYRKSKETTDLLLACSLVGTAVYTAAYKGGLFGSLAPKRMQVEASRRQERLSVGLTQLASAQAEGRLTGQIITDLERNALTSIRSEVEAYIGDVDGTDINVSLLVEYAEDDAKLCCINRADLRRLVPKYYPKSEMLAWRCMEEGVTKHAPDLGKQSKNYRSVLCLPITYVVGDGVYYCGVVTVDSVHPYEFWGIESKLEIILEPYIRLLAISVLLRQQNSLWPWD